MKHFSEADFLQFLSHSIFTNLLKLCFTLVMWHVFCVPIIKCPSLSGGHGRWLKCAVGHSSVSKLKAHILQPLYLGWLTVNARSQDPPVGCRASVPWSGRGKAGCIQNTPTQHRTNHCHSLALRVYLPYLGLWPLNGQYTFENLYSTNFREIILWLQSLLKQTALTGSYYFITWG